MSTSLLRTRWAAIGAAVTITLGGGGLGIANAVQSSGERATFVPITPCRLLDTRPEFDVPGRQTPLGADETHTQDAHGTNGECTAIPADATALALNVTAVNATDATFLTLWPASQPQPNASHLNPGPGQPPTPNAVDVDLSADGQFAIYNYQGNVDVIADIVGYFVDHDHDDRYYTQDEIDTITASLAGADHDHDDRYYTEAELDTITALLAAAEHDHDDRYYTEAEVDARSKWISIDPLGVHTTGTIETGNGAAAGLSLPDGSLATFEFGFTLPPDFTSNAAIRVEFLWHTGQGPCGVDLRSNWSTVSREGQIAVAGSLGYRAPSGVPTSPAANRSVRTTFELRPATTGLQADDGIFVGFFRSGTAPGDTCTTDMRITGIKVIYE